MSRFSCNTCRFDTPKVLVVKDVVETHWPEVRGDHWCGKYEISNDALKDVMAERSGA